MQNGKIYFKKEKEKEKEKKTQIIKGINNLASTTHPIHTQTSDQSCNDYFPTFKQKKL